MAAMFSVDCYCKVKQTGGFHGEGGSRREDILEGDDG